MAKNKVTAPEHEALDEALSKTEGFFQRHGKKIIIAVVALIIATGAFFGYKEFVVKPKMEKASFMLYQAQQHLDSVTPDYQAALDGFLKVIEEYDSTPSGNLAQHYAGVCYLHLGDLDKAASYLTAYEPVDNAAGKVIEAENISLQGDIAVNKKDYAGAVALFKQAAALNNQTTKYINKAVLAARAAGDMATAKELQTKLVNESVDANDYTKNNKTLGTIK